MTTFEFTSNRLTTLDAGTFKGLSQILHLGLDYNYLTLLPATLFHDLVILKSLYLRGNHLSNLPIDIFQNTPNLLTIRLYFNRLTTIGYQHISPNNSEVKTTPIIYNSIFDGLVFLYSLDL